MKIIIAPDSFKGTLSSKEAARIIRDGLLEALPDSELVLCPLADGGEGTSEILTNALNGSNSEVEVSGPLGNIVKASYGISRDTAIIEMAQASGIGLVTPNRTSALNASTFGTGELIKHALDKGVKKIILTIGGSATTDGGTGMLSALGARFLDCDGSPLPLGGGSLESLSSIDLSGLDSRLKSTAVTVASDVSAVLCGENGAAKVFSPQKGASEKEVELLEKGLKNYGETAVKATGKDFRNIPGAGAAGGMGFALLTFLNAGLRPGFDIVCDVIGLTELLTGCDAVITGEGKTDLSSLMGKLPVAVATLVKENNIRCCLISGGITCPDTELKKYFAAWESCRLPGETTESAIKNAEKRLFDAAVRAAGRLEISK